MNDCLVKTLKGESNNGNLEVFGRLVMKAKGVSGSPTNAQLAVGFNGPITVSVPSESGAYFVVGIDTSFDVENRKTSYTITGTSEVVLKFKNDTYDIYIDGKYDETLIKLKAESSSASSIISVNLDDCAYMTKLTELRLVFNSDVIGSINNLGRLTSLILFNTNSTKVSGSIEEFVANQVINGRASTLTGIESFGLLSGFTFGGIKRPTYNTKAWLTWESASKIIVYYGSTIANANTIFAKGATAEEIAAWEQAGKTVVIVS